jgi:hypothetical protein
MADDGLSAYSKKELRLLAKAFSLMGEEAIDEARKTAGGLASYALGEIKDAGYRRTVAAKAVRRVVDGATVSKSSKTGLISIGFAGQRFSGGANTRSLWPGLEFGSNRLKQFPNWSGKYGRGSRGWFIFPTLRQIQPKLVETWIEAVDRIVKKWTR